MMSSKEQNLFFVLKYDDYRIKSVFIDMAH